MSKTLFKVQGEQKINSVFEYQLWDYVWSFYSDYTAGVEGVRDDGGYHFFRWRVVDGKLEAYRDGLEHWIPLPKCAQDAYQAYLANAVMEKLTLFDRLRIFLSRWLRRLRR